MLSVGPEDTGNWLCS